MLKSPYPLFVLGLGVFLGEGLSGSGFGILGEEDVSGDIVRSCPGLPGASAGLWILRVMERAAPHSPSLPAAAVAAAAAAAAAEKQTGVTGRKVRSLRACLIQDWGKRQEGSALVLYVDPGIFFELGRRVVGQGGKAGRQRERCQAERR